MKIEIFKNFKSGPYSNHHAPQNCQQVAVVGTTVKMGRKHPKLDGILVYSTPTVGAVVQVEQKTDCAGRREY